MLIHGDCYKELSKIKSSSVDLILTDPPYNLAQYSTGNINASWRKTLNNDIASWDKDVLDIKKLKKEFLRIIKPTGNIFIFTAYNLLGDFHKTFDPVFDSFQIMVWHKTNPPPKIRRAGFLNSCEIICCMWNKGHTWNFTTQKEMHNFIQSPICMGKERLKHPTQKPVKILKHILKIASNTGDVVLDPFMGVGSTGVACKEMERKFIGIEIEKKYIQMTQDRLDNLNSQFNLQDNVLNNNEASPII